MYSKVEAERLQYLTRNQKQIRAEEYKVIKDVMNNDSDPANLGKLTKLPSSFIGGARYMNERALDAMTYVKKYGRPDILISVTCNRNWPEITRELLQRP